MLYSPALKLAVLAAAPFAIAFASAELRQGPTGVEYVKRFEPSAGGVGDCFYNCPAVLLIEEIAVPLQAEIPLEDGSTDCTYGDSGVLETTYFCNYGANLEINRDLSGLGGDSANGFSDNCDQFPRSSPGCNVRAKRILSPLEKVIKSRQFNPKRRTSKQQEPLVRRSQRV